MALREPPIGFREPKLPLKLDGFEVIHLTDSVANKDIAEGLPEKEAYVPVAREALLLLGSAYCELVAPTGIHAGVELELQVTEEIVWLLRSKVRTGDMAFDNSHNIGVGLLLKFYRLLEEFNSGFADLETVSGDVEMTDENRAIARSILKPPFSGE